MKWNTKTSMCVILGIAMNLVGVGRAAGDCALLAGSHEGVYSDRLVGPIGTILAEVQDLQNGSIEAVVTFVEFDVTFRIVARNGSGPFGCRVDFFLPSNEVPTSDGDFLRIFSVNTGGALGGTAPPGIGGSWSTRSGRSGTWGFDIGGAPPPPDDDDPPPPPPPPPGDGGAGCPTVEWDPARAASTGPDGPDALPETLFLLNDNWIGGHFPGESERASFTRGGQTIHVFADITNTALDVTGISYDFNLFDHMYTLSGAGACTPAVAIGIEPASSFTVRKGTVDGESIELRAGETLLDQATLIGRTSTEIGLAGAGGASLTLENNSTFRGRQVTLGAQRDARADVHSGSRLLIEDDGRLVVGSGGVGQLRIQATIAEGGATLGLGRATLVVGETQDAFDSLVEVTGDGSSIVQTVDFSIVDPEDEPAVLVGVQTGAAGLLRMTSKASAELGPVRLGLEPLSSGRLELSDSQLSADGLIVGRRGAGEFKFSQGTQVSLSSDLVAGEFADSVGRIAMNGSQLLLTTHTVFLGRQGTASLSMLSEPASELASEQLIIGEQAGADGSMTVNGPSGVATGTTAALGVAEGASGAATVHGNAALWIVQQVLEIGIGGNGTVAVQDGGTLIARDAVLGAGAGEGRLSIMNGGRVSIDGTLLVGPVGRGIVEVDATSTLRVGQLDAGEFRVGPGATIRGEIIVGSGFLLDTQKRSAAMQAVNEAPTGIITRALIIEEGASLNEAVVTLEPGGQIGGAGALGVDLTNNGMIAPGLDECSTAVFTMAGNYTQAPAGQLRIKLGGSIPNEEHDALAVAGLATLAGTLRVDAINGFRPMPGETFEILTAGSISGTFDAIEGSGAYDLAYEPNRVVLTVLSSPTEIAGPCVDGVPSAESFPTEDLCGSGLCGGGLGLVFPFLALGLTALRSSSGRSRRQSSARH